MKISYAITVCNEYEEIKKLLSFLILNTREEDEIVVLFDKSSGTPDVWVHLTELKKQGSIQVHAKSFKNHFADWKNLLSTFCSGDYIFQIDADEYCKHEFIKLLPEVIQANKTADVFLVPRINTVEGLTDKHIQKWRWNVNDKGWVNFPDYQYRIWKNNENIKWKNKVHEVLEGYKEFCALPADEFYSLIHPKHIDRQEKQNNYYDTL